MTKEEVLQALEICKEVKGGIGCSGCPYLEMKSSSCLAELLNDAYSLLKECFGEREKVMEDE